MLLSPELIVKCDCSPNRSRLFYEYDSKQKEYLNEWISNNYFEFRKTNQNVLLLKLALTNSRQVQRQLADCQTFHHSQGAVSFFIHPVMDK